MASKDPLDDTCNRSSVEVEQILPCAEHGPDEYFDSGQGSRCVDPEVEDDVQVESIIACHVWFSYLTYTSQANWCEKHSQHLRSYRGSVCLLSRSPSLHLHKPLGLRPHKSLGKKLQQLAISSLNQLFVFLC